MRKDGTRISVEFTIVPFTDSRQHGSALPQSCARPLHGLRECVLCAVSLHHFNRQRTGLTQPIPGRDRLFGPRRRPRLSLVYSAHVSTASQVTS